MNSYVVPPPTLPLTEEVSPYVAYYRLQIRHRRFVDAYCETGNATEALRMLRYRGKNPLWAAKNLLKRPDIKAAVAEREYHAIEAANVKAEKLVRELAAVAFSTPEGRPSWSDKLRAGEMLCKIARLFTEAPNVNLTISLDQLIRESYRGENLIARPIENGKQPVPD